MLHSVLDDRAGGLQVFLALAAGLVALVAGAWGSYVYGTYLLYAFGQLGETTATSTPTLIFHCLWMFGAVMLALTGLSLIVSGLLRRRRDLVPGPTLYLLGLSIVGISIYFLIHHQWLQGGIALVVGLIICYWEYAFDVS